MRASKTLYGKAKATSQTAGLRTVPLTQGLPGLSALGASLHSSPKPRGKGAGLLIPVTTDWAMQRVMFAFKEELGVLAPLVTKQD